MGDENDTVVLSFNDSLLRCSDLRILDGPGWINDNLIGFCFEYFEKEKFSHSADLLALLSPEVVQFAKLSPVEELSAFLSPLCLSEKRYVFLPINDNQTLDEVGGTHWSLLVYVRSKQEFQHFDSSNQHNSKIAKMLSDKIQPHVHAPRGRMKYIEMDTPQQHNGYDCGLFVIAVAEHLCREFCEGYSVPLPDVVTHRLIDGKRDDIRKLIYKVKEDFSS